MISPLGVPGLGQEGLELVHRPLQTLQVAMTPPGSLGIQCWRQNQTKRGCSWALGAQSCFQVYHRDHSQSCFQVCRWDHSQCVYYLGASVNFQNGSLQSQTAPGFTVSYFVPKDPTKTLCSERDAKLLLGSQGDEWEMFYWAICLMSLTWPSYLLYHYFCFLSYNFLWFV